MTPRIGDIVLYRSRTGAYTVPAIVTATVETLNPKGVEAGHIPGLSSPTHVHLTVFSPGKPGLRATADDFEVVSEHPISENVSGCYQEWDIPVNAVMDVPETAQGPGGEVCVPVTPSISGDHPNDIVRHAPGTWAPIAPPLPIAAPGLFDRTDAAGI